MTFCSTVIILLGVTTYVVMPASTGFNDFLASTTQTVYAGFEPTTGILSSRALYHGIVQI